jgi:hypothetical protein
MTLPPRLPKGGLSVLQQQLDQGARSPVVAARIQSIQSGLDQGKQLGDPLLKLTDQRATLSIRGGNKTIQ